MERMWFLAQVPLNKPVRPPSRQSRGFSMVEVLVAIVILSFGLLGVVGLQAAAIKNTRDARQPLSRKNCSARTARRQSGARVSAGRRTGA